MPSTEWDVDASTSRTLRIIAHLPPAGLGGAMLLAFGAGVVFVISNPSVLRSGPALLFALLLVIGGPFSLAYLWSMLADPEQRPSTAEFAGADGFPFTARSVSVAVVSGAIVILGLVMVGAPTAVIYWLVVGCVFSPILVAAATTQGELDGDSLTINRAAVPSHRVNAVRSGRFGSYSIVWISYVNRTGLFVPRLAVIPNSKADEILRLLAAGIDADPKIEPPDRAVQAVLVVAGALFLGVAVVAYVSIDESVVRLYVAAILGGLGVALGLVGVRGT